MELTAFPSPPVVEVNFSDVPVLSIDFPEVPVSVLPEGFIPNVPWFTVFAGSGSGTTTVRSAVAARMVAAGSGTAQVAPRAVVAASASGSGKLTAPAYVVGQAFPTSIEAAGAGDTVAQSSAGTRVAATGSGALTASPGTTIAATGQSSPVTPTAGAVRATGAGTGTPAVVTAARVAAAATGGGTTTVSASTYAPQKMVKSGAYTLPANLAYRDVLGWVADSGYPSTAVVDNGLAVKAGRPITVTAILLRNGTNAGNRARIVDTAGTELAVATSASPITVGPFTYTPTVDTILHIQGYAASGLSGNPTIPDDPASQLTVTPV